MEPGKDNEDGGACEDGEGQPLFGMDMESVLFRRSNNLFRMHLETGVLEQITRISSQPAPREPPEADGHRAFLQEQQLELFEH